MSAYNKDNTNKFSEITEEQLYSLYKYQYKNNFSNFTKKLDDEFLEDFPCMSGRTTLDIDPFLNVTSCPTANFNFANLNNLSLKEFWNNSDEQSLLKHWSSLKRKDFKNCFDKEYCAYCNFCPSKCVNEEEKIGIYCRNAKIKMEVVKSESRL